MGLLGSGLRNGSPFYPGYEYTAPNLTAPTGLLTLASLMPNLGTTAGSSKKTKSTTDGDGETTSSIVPGTEGTRNTIINNLSTIDASISEVKSKIRQNFDKNKNATPEMAVAASSDLAKELGSLIALRNSTKAEISNSNQNLIDLENATSPYKEKDKAWTLGEMAMKEVNGLYMPVGSDDGENALTYGDVKNKAYEADNTYVDDNGVPRVKLVDYSGLSLGASQAGALDAKITKTYKDAKENQTAWGDLNVVPEGDLAGFIKGYKGSNNDTQLLTVATVIKSKLEAPEKADLAAQTVALAQNEKLNATEITKAGLTDSEIYALKKSVTDNGNLTSAELMAIAQAQAKVLAAKVKGDIGLYKDSTFTPMLEKGAYGSGKYDKGSIVVPQDMEEIASAFATPVRAAITNVVGNGYMYNLAKSDLQKKITSSITDVTGIETTSGESVKLNDTYNVDQLITDKYGNRKKAVVGLKGKDNYFQFLIDYEKVKSAVESAEESGSLVLDTKGLQTFDPTNYE